MGLILACVTPDRSVGVAAAATLPEEVLPASTTPGSRDRRYIVHAPTPLIEREDASPALVMVLHGCRQTHYNIMSASRFREIADANAEDADPTNDFIAVFPFITSYPNTWAQPRAENCWGWWIDAHRQEGVGEIADLRRLMAAVEAQFDTDPDRRFVAGLSAGGAMSVAMATVYSEDVAAAGAVAGVPYGEAADAVAIAWPFHYFQAFWLGRDANCLDPKRYANVEALTNRMRAAQTTPEEQAVTPLMTIHSENDCTVELRNAENMRDVWISRYDAFPEPVFSLNDARTDCSVDGVPCRHRRYNGSNGRIVETVFYEGRRDLDTHYWVGDNETAPFSEGDGPSASCLLAEFFGLSPAEDARCPE